jgi:hypothetical protein
MEPAPPSPRGVSRRHGWTTHTHTRVTRSIPRVDSAPSDGRSHAISPRGSPRACGHVARPIERVNTYTHSHSFAPSRTPRLYPYPRRGAACWVTRTTQLTRIDSYESCRDGGRHVPWAPRTAPRVGGHRVAAEAPRARRVHHAAHATPGLLRMGKCAGMKCAGMPCASTVY